MSVVYVPDHKWDTKNTGVEEMKALFEKMEDQIMYVRPDKHVGSFGIKSADGIEHVINWKVSGARRDIRHGCVDTPTPHNRHTKELLESMFKGVGTMTDEQIDKLGNYFVYHNFRERYQIRFDEFIELVETGKWDEFREVMSSLTLTAV